MPILFPPAHAKEAQAWPAWRGSCLAGWFLPCAQLHMRALLVHAAAGEPRHASLSLRKASIKPISQGSLRSAPRSTNPFKIP